VVDLYVVSKFKVYTKIEKKKKLLAPKLNKLRKHGDETKTIHCSPMSYKILEFYYVNKIFVHAKNEHLYVSIKRDLIVVKFIMVLYCTQLEKYLFSF